jgi:glycerol-3-phosphate dehydrogenase
VTKRGDTIGIVGAGSFGTALGSVLARAGRRVVMWSRDPAVVDAITTKRSCPRLPEAPLPAPLEATADPRKLAAEARFLVLAVSSKDVRDRARELGNFVDGSHIVVHAVGALALPTNDRVSEVLQQGLPTLKVGVLAGPALPADLAQGVFSSIVVASTFEEVVREARRLLNVPPALRVYGSKDLAGVELASALAGAYTVALGLCDGLAMGPGPRAVLITRAVAEASRPGPGRGCRGAHVRRAGRARQLAGARERALDRLPARQAIRRRRGHRRRRANRGRARRPRRGRAREAAARAHARAGRGCRGARRARRSARGRAARRRQRRGCRVNGRRASGAGRRAS